MKIWSCWPRLVALCTKLLKVEFKVIWDKNNRKINLKPGNVEEAFVEFLFLGILGEFYA